MKQKLFKWAGWAMEDIGEYDEALLLYKKEYWYYDAGALAKRMGLHEDAAKYAELANVSKLELESICNEEIERILRLPLEESRKAIEKMKELFKESLRKDLK